MILQSKTIKGKINSKLIKTIIFYNQYNENIEEFEYDKVFSLEISNQYELDELLIKLNIDKEILSEHFISYNRLLEDFKLTGSTVFEIKIDLNNNYELVY